MPLPFNCSYAGVPFVSDTATIIRQAPSTVPAGKVDQQAPIRKQQQEVSLVDELNRLLPFHNLNDFRLPAGIDKNLAALARKNPIDPNPEGTRIGEYYYPVGACRWSVFRGLATSSQVKAMLAATYQPNNITPPQWNVGESPARAFAGSIPALFSMTAQPLNPVSELGYTVETSLYMLPPRPLGETLGAEGLFLITLVDERFFWQYSPTSAFMTVFPILATWTGYIQNLAIALGVEIAFSSNPPIPEYVGPDFVGPQYTGPEPDSQLWVNMENSAILLDTVAYNLGCRVVRNLDGTYTLQRSIDSDTTITLNRVGLETYTQRLAGGSLFDPTTKLNTGSRANAVNQVLPNSVNVSFPLYCPLDEPVPHFLNPRTMTPQRPSAWYEESYGDVWIQNIPISSISVGYLGVISETGTIGADNKIEVAPYVHAIHSTAKALVPNDGSLTLLNEAGIIALAQQIAIDYYSWQAGISLDEVYPGTVAWEPEGGHDVVWTYSEHHRLASCRVTRTIWNTIIREMQHTTPTAPDYGVYTNNPPGVGGKTVAQSWKDSYDAYLKTALAAPMGAKDVAAYFTTVDSLPTQNRWFALIDQEVIQFDGTSGGILTEAGYEVTVAQPNAWNSEGGNTYGRGMESTIASEHLVDAAVYPQAPNMTHGVNVVTIEKGQFVHPSDWGEGIQGVNLKPQVQTVYVWSASGQNTNIKGIFPYYSGSIAVSQPDNDGYLFLENIWVQERNNSPVVSGKFYEGQFFGYSINPYFNNLGEQIPTEGAVNPTYLINQGITTTDTTVIALTSTTTERVVLPDQDCSIYAYPALIYQQIGCVWTATKKQCWYLSTNGEAPPIFIRIVAKQIDTDSNGLPVYTKEILPGIVQVTSLTVKQITTIDGSTLQVYPAQLQILDNGKLVNVQTIWFYTISGAPLLDGIYSAQIMGEEQGSTDLDTGQLIPGKLVYTANPETTAIISVNSVNAQSIYIETGDCSTIVYPATLWMFIDCEWTAITSVWYRSVNMDVPPLNVRIVAKQVEFELNTGVGVYTKEIISAVIQVTSLALTTVDVGNNTLLPVYPAQKQVLVNGTFTSVVASWFYPLNSISPSINRRYNCQILGVDQNGKEIWGENPSDVAIISIISNEKTIIVGTGNGIGNGCSFYVIPAQRWRYDGCSWLSDGYCWYLGANNETPPLCIKFVAKQVDMEASTGLGVYSKEVLTTTVQVISQTAGPVYLCGGGGSTLVYPCQTVALVDGSWVVTGLAWFMSLNGTIPLLKTTYACQAITTDLDGVTIWGANIPIPTAAQNINAPANIANPLITLYAYNDQPVDKAFGRIVFTQNQAGNVGNAPPGTFDIINWQGIRAYIEGVGYAGPWPDLQFTNGVCFTWAVADNPDVETINIQGNVDLVCVNNYVFTYIINNFTLLYSNLDTYIIQYITNNTYNIVQDLCPDIQANCITCEFLTAALSLPNCDICEEVVWPCVYTKYANIDCSNDLIWPVQMAGVYARNTIGGVYNKTSDFGHIIWIPQTACPGEWIDEQGKSNPVGGPGGYFSWQGVRLQGDFGGTVGPGEDIILGGTFCPGGSETSIRTTVTQVGNNVRALFNTIGCTGTIDLCWVDDVTFDSATCSITNYYTSITLTFNCGLLTDAVCNFVHSANTPCVLSAGCSDILDLSC